METVFAVVALVIVLFVVFGAYLTVKVVGAAKRSVDRTITQARRSVEDSALRAKSYAQPGPAGELAQLRLRLRTTMRATQDALHAKAAEDASLKESLGLFERLSSHGHELDAELKRLEREPDRATLATRLPDLRKRTQQITESADSLRWAARERAHRFADDDLDSLSAQIDMEAGALRHWTHAPQAPGRRDPGPAPQAQGPGPGRVPSAWPEPPAQDATGAEQTWPDSSSGARQAGAQQPAPPEIAPPVRRPTYSWQKKPRPENTT
ncbi:hypothetical protein GCM10018793_62670 [Streptomyces sulfonofaciens]|uniref:Secreted protein n=1 Tax=Streptomyces sulfonofaciens TaxID=68272 RepID=A0A919GNH3_9ACTN|nr:hypothetical protein [Streptomyces sulfonofaciens]GHH87318.1 hypothetical protein GCM10018793_62670 [Streptomyces sulfonofaciens]